MNTDFEQQRREGTKVSDIWVKKSGNQEGGLTRIARIGANWGNAIFNDEWTGMNANFKKELRNSGMGFLIGTCGSGSLVVKRF